VGRDQEGGQEGITFAEEVQFYKAFHEVACKIQTHFFTKISLSPQGSECLKHFNNLPDVSQVELLDQKMHEFTLFFAYAFANRVNVFMHFLEGWAKATSNYAALAALKEIEKSVIDHNTEMHYQDEQ
jgi:hypothetical protein